MQMYCPVCNDHKLETRSKKEPEDHNHKETRWQVKVCPVCQREYVFYNAIIPVSTADTEEYAKKLDSAVADHITRYLYQTKE